MPNMHNRGWINSAAVRAKVHEKGLRISREALDAVGLSVSTIVDALISVVAPSGRKTIAADDIHKAASLRYLVETRNADRYYVLLKLAMERLEKVDPDFKQYGVQLDSKDVKPGWGDLFDIREVLLNE